VSVLFPNKKYQIIYADPPWTYEKTGGLKNSRGMAKQFYETMSLKDICSLPIRNISCDNACLFLWITYPKLPDGLEVMKSWGFQYFGLGFEWIKKTNTGKDFFGMGYYTRANSEPCFLGFKGKLRPQRHDIRQIIEEKIEEHSKKPAKIRDLIVELMGNLSRIELFARQKTEGWDSWGNEIE
jgi:site-specific DNA-methyltransferase (adenine-specific)